MTVQAREGGKGEGGEGERREGEEGGQRGQRRGQRRSAHPSHSPHLTPHTPTTPCHTSHTSHTRTPAPPAGTGRLSAAVEVDQTQLNRLFLNLVRISERHGIKFPREFGLFLKQILYFDRYTRILAPSLQVGVGKCEQKVRSGVGCGAREKEQSEDLLQHLLYFDRCTRILAPSLQVSMWGKCGTWGGGWCGGKEEQGGEMLKQILYFDRYTRILAPSLQVGVGEKCEQKVRSGVGCKGGGAR